MYTHYVLHIACSGREMERAGGMPKSFLSSAVQSLLVKSYRVAKNGALNVSELSIVYELATRVMERVMKMAAENSRVVVRVYGK